MIEEKMKEGEKLPSTAQGGTRKKLLAITACIVIAICALGMFACQPKEQTQKPADAQADEGTARRYDSAIDPSMFDDPETLKEYVEGRAERDADSFEIWSATVETLADGTQVQKVPNDPRSHNVAVLRGEERGCTSCHTLEEAIEWCPSSHNGLNSYGDDPMGVETCIVCHDGQQPWMYGRPGLEMATVTHNAHLSADKFLELNGNCMSCHHIEPYTGDFLLWDREKYTQYRGLTLVSDLKGEFSFDQDVLTDNNYAFFQLSASTTPHGIPLHSSGDDSVFENHVIEITGLVNNPFGLKLSEIPEDQLVSRIQKMNCSANGINDAFIANAQVKGVPFKTVCEQAGVTGEAVTLICEDGSSTFRVDWLIEKDAVLVFEMNGENLPSELGYPVAMYTQETAASSSRRYITGLEFKTAEEVKKWKNDVPGTWHHDDPNNFYNKPVAAVLGTQDGQIFKDTSSITFEGYVDAFDEQVVEVSFSLDKGKTWQKCDTSSSTIDRWIYWYYKIDGLEPGSYNLRMQATTNTGRVMPVDVNTIFHIQ